MIGYLANHPEVQQKAYDAIQEIYNGAIPDPHDFDRVEYVKAFHTEGSRYYAPLRLGSPPRDHVRVHLQRRHHPLRHSEFHCNSQGEDTY